MDEAPIRKIRDIFFRRNFLTIKYDAVKSIGSRGVQEWSIPISIGRVGSSMIKWSHEIFQVWLSLFNGSDALFSGVCIGQITVELPPLSIKSKNGRNLPKLPQFVGGRTDFLLGIKYLRYYPEKVFQLLSGLTICWSWFKNADGTRGVIGDPHKIFTEIESKYHIKITPFISDQYKLFIAG